MYQKFLSIIGAPCSEQGPSFFHTIDDKSESQYLADLNEYTVRGAFVYQASHVSRSLIQLTCL